MTRNGTPVAELGPVAAVRRTFVSKWEVAAVAMRSGHLDAAAFRADLDRVIDPTL